jgi:hypothetical protein
MYFIDTTSCGCWCSDGWSSESEPCDGVGTWMVAPIRVRASSLILIALVALNLSLTNHFVDYLFGVAQNGNSARSVLLNRSSSLVLLLGRFLSDASLYCKVVSSRMLGRKTVPETWLHRSDRSSLSFTHTHTHTTNDKVHPSLHVCYTIARIRCTQL